MHMNYSKSLYVMCKDFNNFFQGKHQLNETTEHF